MGAKKIIFLNQKGGVGKTTTAVNLGAALSMMGYRTLLIDFDSQGNLSSSVSIDTRAPGTYELIAQMNSKDEVVQTTSINNMYAISGGINLAGLNIELVDQDDRNFFVREALECLDDDYDFILGDCPPSLGLVTLNAMCWADYVIIPMQCEYFAMEGLSMLMKTISNIKQGYNPDLEVLGILFTMYNKRQKLANDVVEDVSEFFRDLVFRTIIPRNVKLAEAPSYGLPITAYDSGSVGSRMYKELAKEVVSRVE